MRNATYCMNTSVRFGILLAVVAAVRGEEPVQTRRNRPNIVLIVADDLGYGELGCYGGRQVPTPHIDSIAAAGVRWTAGYVSCPVCSPSRAGLWTGRYQQRFGHELNPGPAAMADPAFGLDPQETTLAEQLRQAGYTTGLVGKWHLGYREGCRPTDRGIQSFFGFLGGANPYWPNPGEPVATILRGNQAVAEADYLTEALAREASAFIEGHRREPFFLALAFNAVHAPLQAPDPYLEKFQHISDKRRRTFCAMLAALDHAVGTVLSKLRQSDIEDDTLVMFLSDNGGPTPQTTSRNDPFRGTKGTVWEGGIRVPFVMQWNGHLPAGRVDDRPIIALDLFPTSLAAAGVELPATVKLDGVNLLPYLDGTRETDPHTALYWRFGQQAAIRMGDWKLVQARSRRAVRQASDRPASLDRAQLFHLPDDASESRNVAADHPQQVQQLTDAWKAWNAELMAPRWVTRRRST